MHSDYLIMGTDTGVGKTHVTCALLRDLRRRGFNAMGYKPICCGDRAEARAIREVTEPGISLECINPLYLRACAEPLIAAQLQRLTIDPQQLTEGYHKLKAAGYGPVIVDGTGGWETPIAPHYSMADLAKSLGLPVLLVVSNRMGAASLVCLTLNAMERAGVECRGIILNHMGEEWDTAAVTNRQLVEQLTNCSVVAELIHGQEDIDAEALAQATLQS